MVASLDGFIARKDNTVSWLEGSGDVYEKGVSEGNADQVLASIDCYLLGSRTYGHALELGWPYGDTPTIVLTTRKLSSTRKSVEFCSGDLEKLLRENLASRFRSIWLVGGAALSQNFLRLNLVDEISLMVVPVLLGDGLRLFDNSPKESQWQLKNCVAYKSGWVELAYHRKSVA
jgi:dihydrofolate reductase